jgi:hypothetical protein
MEVKADRDCKQRSRRRSSVSSSLLSNFKAVTITVTDACYDEQIVCVKECLACAGAEVVNGSPLVVALWRCLGSWLHWASSPLALPRPLSAAATALATAF